jgi:hypothetical protein
MSGEPAELVGGQFDGLRLAVMVGQQWVRVDNLKSIKLHEALGIPEDEPLPIQTNWYRRTGRKHYKATVFEEWRQK